MSVPVNIEKEFDKWTFDDLVKWASWEVVQGMLTGKGLNSTMHYVLDIALRWKEKK
jgi:hypothetical protein